MECEIEKIGVLRNPVISWEAAYVATSRSLLQRKRLTVRNCQWTTAPGRFYPGCAPPFSALYCYRIRMLGSRR